MAANSNRMHPLVAWRALRRLLDDPERTEEVFNVITALAGPALERGYHRFARTPVGAKVLLEDIELVDTLKDRDSLSKLPANSLGRHYLQFVTSENITADGLVDASTDREFANMSPGVKKFGTRQRDQHDLWHTLTEYGRDELGEVCLLAFTYAQTRNRGVAAICLAGCFKLAPVYGRGIFGAALRAYREGKQAQWLPAQDWEYMLSQPIDRVRELLNIPVPEAYQALKANPLVTA
ncbi:MAG: Coq4 family protein [Pseudomonadota bacterium]